MSFYSLHPPFSSLYFKCMPESTSNVSAPDANRKEHEKRHAELLKELHHSSIRISSVENRMGQLQDNLSHKVGELSAKTHAFGKQHEQELKALKNDHHKRLSALKNNVRQLRDEQQRAMKRLEEADEQKFAKLETRLNIALGAITLLLLSFFL